MSAKPVQEIAVCCAHQAAPVAKAKGKGRYLPKDVAAVAMILLTGLLIAYTGANPSVCRLHGEQAPGASQCARSSRLYLQALLEAL